MRTEEGSGTVDVGKERRGGEEVCARVAGVVSFL